MAASFCFLIDQFTSLFTLVAKDMCGQMHRVYPLLVRKAKKSESFLQNFFTLRSQSRCQMLLCNPHSGKYTINVFMRCKITFRKWVLKSSQHLSITHLFFLGTQSASPCTITLRNHCIQSNCRCCMKCPSHRKDRV